LGVLTTTFLDPLFRQGFRHPHTSNQGLVCQSILPATKHHPPLPFSPFRIGLFSVSKIPPRADPFFHGVRWASNGPVETLLDWLLFFIFFFLISFPDLFFLASNLNWPVSRVLLTVDQKPSFRPLVSSSFDLALFRTPVAPSVHHIFWSFFFDHILQNCRVTPPSDVAISFPSDPLPFPIHAGRPSHFLQQPALIFSFPGGTQHFPRFFFSLLTFFLPRKPVFPPETSGFSLPISVFFPKN